LLLFCKKAIKKTSIRRIYIIIIINEEEESSACAHHNKKCTILQTNPAIARLRLMIRPAKKENLAAGLSRRVA